MPVLEISFHAIELSMALDEDGLPLLHWRISAITEIEPVEGTTEYKGSCVAMEMTSENPRRPTALTMCVVESFATEYMMCSHSLRSIKTTPYPWTKGAHTYKRLAMGPNGVGVTVKTLVRLLLKDWEVHRFELVNRVSGCLHWSTTVIQRLEREGILQEGAIASCKEIVDAARRSGIVGVPENRRGRFFNPDLESIPLAV